ERDVGGGDGAGQEPHSPHPDARLRRKAEAIRGHEEAALPRYERPGAFGEDGLRRWRVLEHVQPDDRVEGAVRERQMRRRGTYERDPLSGVRHPLAGNDEPAQRDVDAHDSTKSAPRRAEETPRA